MERVQLTDDEIDILDKRLRMEGHYLSAGLMRVIEVAIQARLEVEAEVKGIEAAKPLPKKTPWWYFG